MNSCVLLVIVTIVFKTAAQDLPFFFSSTVPNQINSSEDDNDNDVFEDDEVIVYTVIKPEKSDKVQNESLEISERFLMPSSKPNFSKDFDFDDWDLMNENETTLYEEFNQTMLNEMKQKIIGASKIVTTPKPRRLTTPLSTLELDVNMFESEEEAETPPLTTTEEPATPTLLPSPATAPQVPATFELDLDIFETEEPETPSTTPLPTTAPITTVSVSSTEENDSDYIENNETDNIVAITDEPDYDMNEIMNDPCNYEKFPHPIPEIEKTGRRVSDIKCEEYMWHYKLEVLEVEKKKKECKDKLADQKQHVTEIFGGFKALQGDFPHMGAVGWILQTGDIKWMCGSSLISPWFTLTAAHCRRAPSKLILHRTNREPEVVRFGSVFLDNKIIETRHLMAEDVYIAEFLVLDDYAQNPIKKYNDIGLIRLKTEVKMELYIRPACLWTNFPSLGNNWAANITGWGKTTYIEGSESKYLKYAEVDYVEQNSCKRYIHGRRNRHWSEGLKDHQFCAGKLQGGIDACQGDSGGPLQIRSPMPAAMNSTDEVHHVVGITSFGIKCGYPFLPGVYTNVASFLCWVEKNVWPEENNTFCP